jgi:DNA helicase-2/ATP-dependent DNA helicase PcrA
VTERTAALGLKPACRKAMESLGELLTSFRQRFLSRGPLNETLRDFINTAGFEAHFMDETGNAERAAWKMANCSELANHIKVFQDRNEGAGLFEYLHQIALLSETDEEKEERTGQNDRVTLLTAHASKGLEWSTVFVTGLEDGLFPHRKSTEERDEALDEERRLFYVAMTRAKDRLILSSCARRKVFGKETERTLSPFVDEIPLEHIKRPPAPGSPEAEAEKIAGLHALRARIEAKNRNKNNV